MGGPPQTSLRPNQDCNGPTTPQHFCRCERPFPPPVPPRPFEDGGFVAPPPPYHRVFCWASDSHPSGRHANPPPPSPSTSLPPPHEHTPEGPGTNATSFKNPVNRVFMGPPSLIPPALPQQIRDVATVFLPRGAHRVCMTLPPWAPPAGPG